MSSVPLTGTPSIPTVSVRFQDGQAEVKDEGLITMMLNHPGFNQDYIAVEEGERDPYAHTRQGSEPMHVTTELLHGTPVRRSASPIVSPGLSPEIKKLITDQAVAISQELLDKQLPGLIEAGVQARLAQMAEEVVVEENKTEAEIVIKTKEKEPTQPKTKAK